MASRLAGAGWASAQAGAHQLFARDDAQNGAAQKSNSASTVLSTLVPVFIIAAIYFVLFLVLRRKFPRNYSPRSFLGSLREPERSPKLNEGLFNWVGQFLSIPDTFVLTHHSLDGYLFLRLLRMSVISCLVGCLITWPVLFPVNITGGGGQKQLDMLSMSNVTNNYWRYLAHTGCAYLFFGFVMFMITRECIFYINLRQAYLMSPLYAHRLSSRTVLFASVPPEYRNEAAIRAVLGPHVSRVWLPSNTNELEKMTKERDKVAMKLEAAETKLIKQANVARSKAIKKGLAGADEQATLPTENAETGSVAERWLSAKQRPSHRLSFLIGKKVDTITWARAELPPLNQRIETEQVRHRSREADLVSSVFVEFDTLVEAQAAYQSLTHHHALHMAPRFTGMTPGEIIWSNLRIRWWERVLRKTLVTAFIFGLIVYWSIPVAFVASLSNINYLFSVLPWLKFLQKIPSSIFGLVTGLLPTILLAVLMALLPIILRLCARLSGDPTLSAVELSVQNSYFAFQVVQVFLVATLGSAASSAAGQIIKNPSTITTLLSKQIPKASNFYLAYFILQGLGVVSGMLVGIVGLVIFKLLSKILDSTPRKMYQRWTQLAGVGWGTVFPVYTNLFVIALCYACISPLVLAFAAIGLYFFYFAYRYNLLFVYNAQIDTKGLVYPRALQQIFVGLYIAEGCLIGLFAIRANKIGSLISLILMLFLLAFTVVYNMSLNAALQPLLNFLPKTLVAEERRLLELENGFAQEAGVEPKSQQSKELVPAPHAKPSIITKFLRPDVYNDYETMRRLVPRDFAQIEYSEEIQANAYHHPAITSKTPLLWIPRDPAGVSRQEVRDTSASVPITDEGAHLDEHNNIVWDTEGARPPIFEEKIYY